MPCRVLNCPNDPDTVWVENAWGRRIELLVCLPHHASLNGGAPRRLADDNWILMNADLAATGELLVAHFSIGNSANDAASSDPEYDLHLVATGHPRGSDKERTVDLVLTREAVEQLHEFLGAEVMSRRARESGDGR